jgi:hypothetical protein
VEVQITTTRYIEVDAADLDEAIALALARVREDDPQAEPQIASVLDPDDTSGNSMPLQEWFAE